MTFEGDMVIVAGFDVVVVVVVFELARSVSVRVTTVIFGPPEDTANLCCGDLAKETGIIVILVGVLTGEIGTLFTGMFTLAVEPGNVVITVLPGETMPCEEIVTVFVGV